MYIIQTDLETAMTADEFLQLTDRTNDPPTTPDATVINAAIAVGTARLHGPLARRFALPLSTADATLMAFIKPIVTSFAWEALYPRASMAPKELRDDNDAHDKTLNAIADGERDLPASAPPVSPAAGGEAVVWSASPRKTMGGMP